MNELSLREDKYYTRAEIKEKLIREFGMNNQLASQVFDELIDFVRNKLSPSIKTIVETLYRDLDIESPLPTYDANRDALNFGQWIGVFEFKSESLGKAIILRITPKIARNDFEFMLNDSLRIIEMVGFPAIDPLFANIRGFSFAHEVISYSVLLQQYTELALREGLPPTVIEVEEQGEAVIGTPNYVKTINYLTSGLPLAVVIRRSTVPASLPAIILAKFHMRVLSALRKLIKEFDGRDLEMITRMLLYRSYYHAYILTSEKLYPFSIQARSLPMEEIELIEEARKQAERNWWLKALIDLYIAFNARVPTMYTFERRLAQEAPLQPLPTSKIYELWVLKLLVEALSYKGRPRLIRDRGGFEVSFDDRKLVFNLSRREWSRLISTFARPPRPDYILAGKGRIAVADAKYKERLDTGDVERMIAYIVDYAEPQEENHNEIKGFLLMLRSPVSPPVVERIDITPKLKIYVNEINPSEPRRAKKTATIICNKVFGD